MTLVPSFMDLVQPLHVVMTTPSFNNFLPLLTGWVYARRRTVAGMIVAADVTDAKHHIAFHRLFANAAWSLDALGQAVFMLIQPRFDPDAPVMLRPRRHPGTQAGLLGLRRRDAPRPAAVDTQDRGHELGAQLGRAGGAGEVSLLRQAVFRLADPVPPVPQQAVGGQAPTRLPHAPRVGHPDARCAVSGLQNPACPRGVRHALRRTERAQPPAGQLGPDQPAVPGRAAARTAASGVKAAGHAGGGHSCHRRGRCSPTAPGGSDWTSTADTAASGGRLSPPGCGAAVHKRPSKPYSMRINRLYKCKSRTRATNQAPRTLGG